VRARELVSDVPFTRESIYELPRPAASVDTVVCLEVLEHLGDPEAGLRELARVTQRHVILSVPREPLWRLLNMARGAYLRDWGNTPGHLRNYLRTVARPPSGVRKAGECTAEGGCATNKGVLR